MKRLLIAGLLVLAINGTAIAQEAGDWKIRSGPYVVDPKSDNNDVVNVDAGAALGINFTYFFTRNWAFEVLAATPFSHDINLNGGGEVGETKHLPPTFSLQYHFDLGNAFKPYVGLGVNYTLFFDEELSGALAGSDLSLDNSFGVAAQLGADYDLNDRWTLGANVRWIDIDTEAEVDGAGIGDVEIDPIVYGITLGYRF
ncbi:MAG: OmpW family outer membrane protein [Pseudomonadota bacterium]